MKTFPAFFGFVSLCTLFGCASAPENTTGDSADALRRLSSVRLPESDPCRAVLGPLALGLARGVSATGTRTEVSLTEESYRRVYTVEVQGVASASWNIVLDNDSSFMCFLDSLDRDDTASLTVGETRTVAGPSELSPSSAPLDVPAGDPCDNVLALVATGAAMSHVSPSYLLGTEVHAVGTSLAREYSVTVDGAPFVANGRLFDNDAHFAVDFDATAATTCAVQRMYPTP